MATWHILVVDDDRDVHALTNIVLENIKVYNRGLQIYSVYSEEEACDFIKENPQINLVLLDMIMENDDSGLNVVKYIRSELKNLKTRIILRSGNSVIDSISDFLQNYDISDCKIKNELSAKQFRSSIIAAIEEYDDLSEIPTEIMTFDTTENPPLKHLNSIEQSLRKLEQSELKQEQRDALEFALDSLNLLKGCIDK
jgi:CheY-like chemotaxis protein